MANLAYSYEDERRTEMLDGVIYMMATPGLKHHLVSNTVYKILDRYLRGKKCMAFSDGLKVFLTENDRVVPDAMVVCSKDIIKDDGIYGAPDLIVEILSPSTAKHDRNYKKDLYERCGVKEYWIVDVEKLLIDVYWLTDGKYVLHDVFALLLEHELMDMTEERRAKFPTKFKTSLFDDLIIDLEEVFEDVRERPE